jgi:hypothetical protein
MRKRLWLLSVTGSPRSDQLLEVRYDGATRRIRPSIH